MFTRPPVAPLPEAVVVLRRRTPRREVLLDRIATPQKLGRNAPRECEFMSRLLQHDATVKYYLTNGKYDFTYHVRGKMIESFRHKGLRQLFEDDNTRGVSAEHVRKIKQILAVLHAAETIEALRLPTFGLHPLKGDLKGFWAVTVRANWRIIFRFEDGKATNVDLVDYH
jgi:toxin HigB-1